MWSRGITTIFSPNLSGSRHLLKVPCGILAAPGPARGCRMWVRMRILAVITEGSKSLERKRTKAKSETDAIKCLRQIYLQPSRATVNIHTQTADKKDEPRSLKDEHLGLSFILCPNKPIQLVILHKQSSGHQLEDIDSLRAGQIRKDPGKRDGSSGEQSKILNSSLKHINTIKLVHKQKIHSVTNPHLFQTCMTFFPDPNVQRVFNNGDCVCQTHKK